MVECGTGDQVGADDIDAEDVNPSIGVGLGEWLEETEAGDVDNQIEATHPLGRGGDHCLHGPGSVASAAIALPAPQSAMRELSLSWRRAEIVTLAPASIAACPSAAPIPADAPTIRTRRPVSASSM